MSEIINLATFNLDTQRLTQSLESLQNKYFDLRKEQKAVVEQSKELNKQIINLEKTQKTLADSGQESSQAYIDNKKQLDALVASQKELYRSEQNIGVQMASVRKEINLTTTQIKSYQDAEGRTRSLIDLGNEALGRQIKNKNDAKAANIALNNVSDQLNPNIEEEALLLEKLSDQVDKNTAFIKSNSSETAKQKMNIGNYKSALDSLDSVLSELGVSGPKARTIVTGFSSVIVKGADDITNMVSSTVNATKSFLGFQTAAQKAAATQVTQTTVTEAQTVANSELAVSTASVTTATNGSTLSLRAFTIALAATGIGLIVIALGSLLTYLTRTQAGIDKLNAILVPLKAVFSGLVSLTSSLGEKLFDAFSNPKKSLEELGNFVKQNLINRFTAFGVILEGIINLDFKKVTNGVLQAGSGVENLTGKIANGAKEVGKFLNENVKKGSEISKLQRDINEKQLEYNAAQVAVNDKLDQQLLISKDTSKSFAERAAAANEIIRISDENGKKEEAILQLKLKQLKIEQSIKGENNLTNEDRQKTIDLLEQIDAAEDRGLNARLEQSKVLSGLKKEEGDAQLRATDEAIAKNRQAIDLFISQQGFRKKSLEEEYSYNKQLYDKELADAKLRFKNQKLSEIEYRTEVNKITDEFARRNTEIVVQNAELELNAQLEKNQRILDSDKYLSQEQLKLQQDALAADLKLNKDFLDLKLKEGIITQQEYNAEINKINADNKKANEELAIKEEEDKRNKALIDLENKSIAEEANFIAQAEIEKERNAILMAQEIKAAEQTGADVNLIKDKYAKLDEAIDYRVMDSTLSVASQTFGNLATIFGEQSKAGKAAGIAQATIDALQASAAAFRGMIQVFPGPAGIALGAVAAASALATGFATVKKITAVQEPKMKKPSFASGVIGIRGVGTESSDQISANLSAGESVINAKSTAMYANELSAINQAGGGVGINGASNIVNQNIIQQKSDSLQMASMIAEAVALGAEKGTSKGAQSGIVGLSENRKVMQDAKF